MRKLLIAGVAAAALATIVSVTGASAAPNVAPTCQGGTQTVAVVNSAVAVSAAITIDDQPPYAPLIMTNVASQSGAAITWNSNAVSITPYTFKIRVASYGDPQTINLTVQWLACTSYSAPTTPGPTPTTPPTTTPTTPPSSAPTMQPPTTPPVIIG